MTTHRKIDREWWVGLRRLKLYGNKQQSTESWRSRWGVLIEEARVGWSAGEDVVPSFGATIGMTKKIEGKWGLGLRWLKFYGKTQQPAESWRSQWGVLIEEARLGWSAGGDVVPSFGATIGTKKK
jgi:hypothetical protein